MGNLILLIFLSFIGFNLAYYIHENKSGPRILQINTNYLMEIRGQKKWGRVGKLFEIKSYFM